MNFDELFDPQCWRAGMNGKCNHRNLVRQQERELLVTILCLCVKSFDNRFSIMKNVTIYDSLKNPSFSSVLSNKTIFCVPPWGIHTYLTVFCT